MGFYDAGKVMERNRILRLIDKILEKYSVEYDAGEWWINTKDLMRELKGKINEKKN